ncbi:hypothetical protein EBT25_16090, partial [bacterium]|nr:hypothetical protein [bacterium]
RSRSCESYVDYSRYFDMNTHLFSSASVLYEKIRSRLKAMRRRDYAEVTYTTQGGQRWVGVYLEDAKGSFAARAPVAGEGVARSLFAKIKRTFSGAVWDTRDDTE